MRARAAAALLAALVACVISAQSFSSAAFTATTGSTAVVTAASDWTPPTVSVSSPTTGQIVSGQVTVTAAASDARSAVATVRIEVAPAGSSTWQSLCTDSAAPWSCPWTTTTVTDGDYELRAVATDAAGLSATSDPVAVRVANAAGVVLGPVASVFRTSIVLEATVVGTGLLPADSISFQYRVSPSGAWATLTGCTRLLVRSATCTWTPTGAAEVYDVRAVAVVGLTTYTDTEPALQFDPTPPTATLEVPAGTLSGTVVLRALADDDDSGVTGVRFDYRRAGAVDWATCGTAAPPELRCALDTTTFVNGSAYDFRAVATDQAGNTTTTAIQSRVVDNTAASVSVTVPTAGSVVRGTVQVTATAYSTQGVAASVRLETRPAGGTWGPLCTDATAPYSCAWDTSVLPSGSHELRAVLTQVTGPDVVSAVVTVTVDNAVLRALDVSATNSGTSGLVTTGDQLVLTYSAQVAPGSVKAGWTGAPTPIALSVEDKNVAGGSIAGYDRIRFTDAALGQVAFVQNYVRTGRSVGFAATMAATTATVNGVPVTVVTVTVGAPTGATTGLRTSSTAGAMRWMPSASATTPGGSACSVAPATETGPTDKDL